MRIFRSWYRRSWGEWIPAGSVFGFIVDVACFGMRFESVRMRAEIERSLCGEFVMNCWLTLFPFLHFPDRVLMEADLRCVSAG